jgi:hypothetical protein
MTDSMEALKSTPTRSAVLVITGAATLSIAIWLGYRAWGPAEQSLGDAALANNEVSSELPAIPVPADPKDSLLGTNSSMSPDPLALVLVATAPGKTVREGTASLGTDPRNPQTYGAGATLVNGAQLAEIHRDHVVLDLDGKRSVLAVGGKTLGRRLAQLVASSDSTALTVGGAEVVTRPLDTVPTSREDMSDVIRPEPFYERDAVAGIRILPGRDRSRLEALGLMSGDIIRAVDGKPIRSIDASWKVIDDALSTGTPIVVSIDRDGTLTSVFLDGSKLAQDSVQASAAPLLPSSPGT